MAVLQIQNLCKEFTPGKAVLQNIQFSIQAGDSLALVGANGAGKSTLIKIILGVVRATKGDGLLFGSPLGTSEALKKVGYLPEAPGYWMELSGRELLKSTGELRGMSQALIQERSEKLLGTLGLRERSHRKMGTYSKGMLQRVGIACALLHDPDFLILDEPMSGLDPRAQEKLKQILEELRRRGKTLLISSHSLEDIRRLCSHVLVLEKSEMSIFAPVSEGLQKLQEKYQQSEPWDDDPMIGDMTDAAF